MRGVLTEASFVTEHSDGYESETLFSSLQGEARNVFASLEQPEPMTDETADGAAELGADSLNAGPQDGTPQDAAPGTGENNTGAPDVTDTPDAKDFFPASTLDLAKVSILGTAEPAEGVVPDTGIAEERPVHVAVNADAFSPAVDSLDVAWLIGGVVVHETDGLEAHRVSNTLELVSSPETGGDESANPDAFFGATFTPVQGSAGASLSVELVGHRDGALPSVNRVSAGWIGQGTSITLKEDAVVTVSDPRVGEIATAKIKRTDFVPTATQLRFQWLSNDAEIEGATQRELLVTPSLRGRSLTLLVEADAPGALTSTVDVELGVVALGDAPEYLGETPRIKGSARVGEELRVAGFERDFIEPDAQSVEFQWMRGKESIPGARGKKYEVREADRGEKLWVRIVLRRLGHRSAVVRTDRVRVAS